MFLRNHFMTGFIVAGLMLGGVACSSSSTSTDDDDTGTDTDTDSDTEASDEEESGTAFAQISVSSIPPLGDVIPHDDADESVALLYTVTSADCAGGGTLSYDDATLIAAFDECMIVYGETTVTYEGTVGISADADGVFTVDEDGLTVSAVTGDDSLEVTMSGAVQIVPVTDSPANIVTDGLSASADIEGTATEIDITGTVTIATDIMDGTLTVTVGGAEIECVFTDFDLATATDVEWDAACTEI